MIRDSLALLTYDWIKMAEPEVAKDELNPNDAFMKLFQASHDLNDKLLLLDYLKEFCPLYKCRPLHR